MPSPSRERAGKARVRGREPVGALEELTAFFWGQTKKKTRLRVLFQSLHSAVGLGPHSEFPIRGHSCIASGKTRKGQHTTT